MGNKLPGSDYSTMHTDKEPFWRLPLWKPGQNKGKNSILQLGLQCNILWLGLTLYHTHNYYMIGLRPLTWQIYIDSRAGKGHKPSVHTADPPPALYVPQIHDLTPTKQLS